MGKPVHREWTIDEFEEWQAASGRVAALQETANEVGGPQLSLVPLSDAARAGPEPDNLDCPVPFEPEASRNRHGAAGSAGPGRRRSAPPLLRRRLASQKGPEKGRSCVKFVKLSAAAAASPPSDFHAATVNPCEDSR